MSNERRPGKIAATRLRNELNNTSAMSVEPKETRGLLSRSKPATMEEQKESQPVSRALEYMRIIRQNMELS